MEKELNNELMINKMEMIISSDSIGLVKTFLECPRCGEYHSLNGKLSVADAICIYCKQSFNIDNFRPAIIVYKKE